MGLKPSTGMTRPQSPVNEMTDGVIVDAPKEEDVNEDKED